MQAVKHDCVPLQQRAAVTVAAPAPVSIAVSHICIPLICTKKHKHPADLAFAAVAAACRGTPGLLSTLGLAAAAGAAAVVYFVPDDTTALVAAQAVGATALGAAAVAALVGANILGSLQKV